ncbi:hypothetical protein CAEBREN_21940 [Caenorhabditis brenneri]|uniref:Uncharacterized protein n=1 Tax=Caenorhabditis brenneri TaxID=135651 RepID=G0M8G0_CAEBE|nr:hypothetical protein CAEBREN_21940 [Caenorhabditis brenneri]
MSIKKMTLKDFLKEGAKREAAVPKTIRLGNSGSSNDDSVTVHINMNESSNAEQRGMIKTLSAHRQRVESARGVVTMTASSENYGSEEPPSSPKMEVKITINMKQLEKHHRDIESYISPFTPSPDSIFLRIPPRPEDYAHIENIRDEVDNLVNLVHQLAPDTIPEDEAREFLQKLRMLDVRLTALYPRQPAPGDKNKKSYRMCPCFEPEVEDIEKLVIHYNQVFNGMSYIYRMKQYAEFFRNRSKRTSSQSPSPDDLTPEEFQNIQESFEKMSLNETA